MRNRFLGLETAVFYDRDRGRHGRQVESRASATITLSRTRGEASSVMVNLLLSSPTGGAIVGPRSTAVLTIQDND